MPYTVYDRATGRALGTFNRRPHLGSDVRFYGIRPAFKPWPKILRPEDFGITIPMEPPDERPDRDVAALPVTDGAGGHAAVDRGSHQRMEGKMTKFSDDVVKDAGWFKANWRWLRWVLCAGAALIVGLLIRSCA
jgi:hypothetical protein